MTTIVPIPGQLVSNPTPVPNPPAPDQPVTNDGFFPDIDAAALRQQYRIRDAVIAARLREAILGAMLTVGNELDAWAVGQQAAGYASLADVPAKQLGDESRLVILYRRAIGAETRALLIEGQRDMDLTGKGDRQVSDLDPSIGELRRDRLHAVHDILGRSRATIELL